MSYSVSTARIFQSFQQYINDEQDIREEIRTAVKDLEQKTREILAVIQGIHQADGINQLNEICSKTKEQYPEIQTLYQTLQGKVPTGQYYRFHDHWRFGTQRLCFIAALVFYLETEKLISQQETAEVLKVQAKREDGFHLELDDYLMGLLQMASELSRLAVNAVTAGDYSRPMRIARFMGELDSGFRLLNLKNDSLRKKFDGLKYDMKKVEEVVYDVTIRGLKPQDSAATTEKTSATT